METFTRQFGRTRVTFNVNPLDLPYEYWDFLINDVKAVVTDNPVHRTLHIDVNMADFNDIRYVDFMTLIQCDFDCTKFMNGLTEIQRYTHVHLNPRIHTHEGYWTDRLLYGEGRGYSPKSAAENFSRYITAHEYAHTIFRRRTTRELAEAYWNDFSVIPTYGKGSLLEATADAYADWFMTKGQSDNVWTRDAARVMQFPHYSERG